MPRLKRSARTYSTRRSPDCDRCDKPRWPRRPMCASSSDIAGQRVPIVLRHTHRMSEGRRAAGFADAIDRFLNGNIVALHVAACALIQILIEGVLHVLRITFVDEHPGKMRTRGQRLSVRFHLFERDRDRRAIRASGSGAGCDRAGFRAETPAIRESPESAVARGNNRADERIRPDTWWKVRCRKLASAPRPRRNGTAWS